MASQTIGHIDLADVKTVLELEPQLQQLLKAIEAAMPAIERLEAADYAVAGELRYQFNDMLGDLLIGKDRTPGSCALEYLVRFRIGEGSMAPVDYRELVEQDELTIGKAMAELLDRDSDNMDRVDGFRRYAAARLRGELREEVHQLRSDVEEIIDRKVDEHIEGMR